jgi:hypothetical protein
MSGTTFGPGFSAACTKTGCTAIQGTSTHAGSGGSQGYGVLGTSDQCGGGGVGGTTSSTCGATSGVQGFAYASTGYASGVYGRSYSPNGLGVIGYSTPLSGTSGYGVNGLADGSGGYGVWGVSSASAGYGGYFENTTGSSATAGVQGYAYYGVMGESPYTNGVGVTGTASGTSGVNYGVTGQTSSSSGYAAWFWGRSENTGDFHVGGTLSKTFGTFKIDHPLDPENKFLLHSFVESSEVLNLYTGTVQLDGKGEAWITMPAWFDALNKEFRYQLTAIKAPGPNLHISEEMHRNRFKVAGGQPGSKVSWQVTGIRHDPYVEMHPMLVEQAKTSSERGKYIFPQGYGQPESKSLNAEHIARISANQLAHRTKR